MTSLLILALAAGCLAQPSDAPRKGEGAFLERRGAQLYYGGKPFAAVGVNKHELLDQYMAGLLGASPEDAARARAAARQSLAALKAAGVTVVRVRMSGFWPARIERTYLAEDAAARQAFWQALDAMLADCDRYGLRVVATIAWHLGGWADLAHESLQDLFTDPDSASRALLHRWITDLVSRYKDRDTILFWELTNEANLAADLRPQHPHDGVLGPKLTRPAPHIVRGPVVRDGRNNYSSDELAALMRELARLIKRLDSRHLVGTGFSRPRRAAWHLWLGSLRRADRMDWTPDTPEEGAYYLWLISPDPIDLVSLHTYGPDFQRMLDLKLAAEKIGKPVYLGEAGVGAGNFDGPVYGHAPARQALKLMLAAWREMRIPLTLLWTWDEYGKPVHEPVLRPDQWPELAALLRDANQQALAVAGEEVEDVDLLRAKLADYAEQVQRLLPGPKK
ncbi:MAG: cellulase family glycosylhydrolase [Armatimonadetes bacterium]|nr:cellulase family glycosylhydrolase [Armatimonadota bacterium]